MNASNNSNFFDQAFGRLRVLDIAAHAFSCADYAEQLELAKSIKKLVSAAEQQLEKLKVGDPGTVNLLYLTAGPTPMGDLLGTVLVSHLRYLAISRVEATVSQLTHFFWGCRNLVEVHLDFVNCQDEKWSVVLDRLRSFQYRKLKWFSLWDCRDSDGENAHTLAVRVHDYLLHRTDRNPWLVVERHEKDGRIETILL